MKAAMKPTKCEEGFSVIELMIVIAVIIILTAVTVFSLAPHKRAYRAEDASAQIVNFMRQANQRALTDRQSMRLVVNRLSRRISIIDENTIAGGGNNEDDTVSGDDLLVRQEDLIPSSEIRMDQPMIPGPMSPPPAPYNYPAAVFASDLWVAHFESDGSVTALVGGTRVPISATFFFWPPNPGNAAAPASLLEVRAVTLFGPSSSVRYWRYDGTQLAAEMAL